jgi:hypothetical protein
VLEKGYLRQLSQFSNGPAKFVLSVVVKSELEKHVAKRVRDAREKVSTAIRLANKHLDCADEECAACEEKLCGVGDDVTLAGIRVSDFIEASGAEVIGAEYVDAERLTDMYFNSEAPFEETGKKKNEFPDALALLAIESWAEDNGKILAVSLDNGWKKFAEDSDWVDVIDDIGHAIQKFQIPNFTNRVIEELDDVLLKSSKHHIIDAIGEAISDSLDGVDIDIEAVSSFGYDYEYPEANVVNFEFSRVGKLGGRFVELVRIEPDRIVVRVSALVECTVACDFSFYVYDGIDKEDIELGSNSLSTEESYNTDILITIVGAFSDGLNGVEIDEIEVLDTIKHADFGDISIDWGEPDEELSEESA